MATQRGSFKTASKHNSNAAKLCNHNNEEQQHLLHSAYPLVFFSPSPPENRANEKIQPTIYTVRKGRERRKRRGTRGASRFSSTYSTRQNFSFEYVSSFYFNLKEISRVFFPFFLSLSLRLALFAPSSSRLDVSKSIRFVFFLPFLCCFLPPY